MVYTAINRFWHNELKDYLIVSSSNTVLYLNKTRENQMAGNR
jgi:hypothetical protein